MVPACPADGPLAPQARKVKQGNIFDLNIQKVVRGPVLVGEFLARGQVRSLESSVTKCLIAYNIFRTQKRRRKGPSMATLVNFKYDPPMEGLHGCQYAITIIDNSSTSIIIFPSQITITLHSGVLP